MKNLFASLIGMLIFAPAGAKFVPWEEAITVRSLTQAAARIEFNGVPEARCAGTLISNKGHFVTAAHCMIGCFVQQGLHSNLSLQAQGATPNPDHINYEVLAGTSCHAILNGWPTEVKVLFVPNCTIAEMKKAHREFDAKAEVQKPECLQESDIALLKIASLPAGLKCARLSKRAAVGDKTYTLGYPIKTRRMNGRDSNGLTLQYSEGHILAPQGKCLKEGKTQNFQSFNARAANLANFQSDVDIYAGSSGGGLFNWDNELIGVTSYSAGFTTDKIHCWGDSFFARLYRAPDSGLPPFSHEKELEGIQCETL